MDCCRFIDALPVGKPYDVEAVFVDDGSNDDSVEQIEQYPFVHCASVQVVQLSKNFGSHAAIRAGILHATGEYCTFIGADLQEPPDMIDKMYAEAQKGYEAVYVERGERGAGGLTKLFSSAYSALMRRYAVKNFGSGGVNSILISRKIVQYINANIENNSSILLQIIDAGFKNTSIKMDYHERQAGASKWTLGKKIKLFIDSFVAFSFMPIRLVSMLGIAMAIIGFAYGVFLIIYRLVSPQATFEGYTTLVALILFTSGITNISLGVIAEYLWRAYDAARGKPAFIVSEVTQVKAQADSTTQGGGDDGAQ